MRNAIAPLLLLLAAVPAHQAAAQQQPAPTPEQPAAQAPAPGSARPTTEVPMATRRCEITSAGLCQAGSDCRPTDSFDDRKLPARWTFDLKERVVVGLDHEGWPVASPIDTLSFDQGLLIAQGIELGRTWTAQISPQDGALVITVALGKAAAIGLGSCTETPY